MSYIFIIIFNIFLHYRPAFSLQHPYVLSWFNSAFIKRKSLYLYLYLYSYRKREKKKVHFALPTPTKKSPICMQHR